MPQSLTGGNMLDVTDKVPGASELTKWFGYWPSFHDAEVLDIELHRTGHSTVRIHTFETSSETNSQGFFICTKHVIVGFILEGLKDLHLNDFNGQNVITGLDLKQIGEGYELTLEGCHGVDGTLTADRIHIDIEPGLPPDSQYRLLA
jgi:hypothetical protein